MQKLPLVSLDRPRAYVKFTADTIFRTKVHSKTINLDLSATGSLVGVEFLKTTKTAKQLIIQARGIRKAVNSTNGTPLASKEGCIWRVHTPNLLKEILKNPGTGALRIPLNIFREALVELGERAIQLDDSKLNKLMLRLTIYAASDPESPDYNPSVVEKYLR